MNPKVVVDILKEHGYRVKVAHLRVPDGYDLKRNNRISKLVGVLAPKHELREKGMTPSPRGGATLVSIWSPEGEPLAEYTEFCSVDDNFNKRIGYTRAVGKAISSWGAACDDALAKLRQEPNAG